MAIRVRKVVSDNSSQEVDELRRQFNNLLLVLENVCAEVAATTVADAETGLEALGLAISSGLDSTASVTNHVGTGRELNGVRPTPTHPRRARVQKTETADATIDF